MSNKVIISAVQVQQTIEMHGDRLRAAGLEVILPTVRGQQLDAGEMRRLVPGVGGILAGDDVISRSVLEAGDALRVISKWGVGVDNIDLVAARERGVRVTNTPGVLGDEVADVVVGYLVLLARGLHRVDRTVREGGWPKPRGTSLAGRTMGIVGLGDIGCEVARRTLAMRMRVVGCDPDPAAAATARALGVEVLEFPALLREADAISINAPLNPGTNRLFDEDAIASMRPGAWLINTARGGIVDEPALVHALEDGSLGGAALDVFAEEPLPAASPLRALDNVILGSHNSSNTVEAVERTTVRAIDNLLEGLA